MSLVLHIKYRVWLVAWWCTITHIGCYSIIPAIILSYLRIDFTNKFKNNILNEQVFVNNLIYAECSAGM